MERETTPWMRFQKLREEVQELKSASTLSPSVVSALENINQILEENDLVFTCLDLNLLPYLLHYLNHSHDGAISSGAMKCLQCLLKHGLDSGKLRVTTPLVTTLIGCLDNATLGETSAALLTEMAIPNADLRRVMRECRVAGAALNIYGPQTLRLITTVFKDVGHVPFKPFVGAGPAREFAHTMSWFVCTLFQSNDPEACSEKMTACLPILIQTLGNDTEPATAELACKAASFILGSGPIIRTQKAVDHGFLPILEKLLISGNETIIRHAVKSIGRIARGGFKQNTAVLDSGCPEKLLTLLERNCQLHVYSAVLDLDYVSSGLTTRDDFHWGQVFSPIQSNDAQALSAYFLHSSLDQENATMTTALLQHPGIDALLKKFKELCQRHASNDRNLCRLLRRFLLLLSELEEDSECTPHLQRVLSTRSLLRGFNAMLSHDNPEIQLYAWVLTQYNWTAN